MKFGDLEFKEKYQLGSGMGYQARHDFPNGYGVSVIFGGGAFSELGKPYELAVMKDGALCYDTEITDDVLGCLTESEVSELLERIEGLL